MKFNRILMVSLLLVILTSGAVSAANETVANDNMTMGEDIQINDVENSADSFSNLSYEIMNVEQDGTLILKTDYAYNLTADDVNGILIDKSMVIDGEGHYIDADYSSRIFDIQTDNLILKNIVFKNLDGNTAFVCSAYNCTFMGADIYSDTLLKGNFYGCDFINCHANNPVNQIFKGTAYNCTFVNCTGWGGSNAALGELVNCTLINFQDPRPKSNINIQILTGDKRKLMENNSAYVAVEFESMNGGYVFVTIDNQTRKMQSCSIGMDWEHWELNNLSEGNHTVFVQFNGDEIYQPTNATETFVIVARVYEPQLISSDLKMQYNDGSKFTVTLYGFDGLALANENIVFKIDGKKVGAAKTNSKGQASITISKIPKTYKISAETTTLKTKLVVNKKLTVKRILSLKTVKVKKSAKKLILTATLSKVKGKYLKYKKITFKFNGKKYTARTNSHGVAKVTIKSTVLKKLKVGKKVIYQATYVKDTVKKSVKIKK